MEASGSDLKLKIVLRAVMDLCHATTMARKLRLQYEGAIYHVSVRGNGRRRIFRDDRDRDRLLWRLCESKDLYDVRVYLYCLMENHFHLLVETPRSNISRFMQSALTGYTVYYNLRHHTSGHVMQGRFAATLVDGDRYLLNVSRYVHLNPVHVNALKDYSLKQKVQYLRAYRWSSYRGYIDPAHRNELVEYEPLLRLMHRPAQERERAFRSFVENGLNEVDEALVALMHARQRSIGSKDFCAWVDDAYEALKKEMATGEDVSFRREGECLQSNDILDAIVREFRVNRDALRRRTRDSIVRPVAAWLLCKHGGLTQRAAADVLAYGTGAAVSMQLKRPSGLLADETSEARRHVARIEKKLRCDRT